jgi:hypothetical protein
MHTNFITPPDIIESILIVDATDEEIYAVGLACENADKPYNVYMYKAEMDNLPWLSDIIRIVDMTLQRHDSTVPIQCDKFFGPDNTLKTPADFFNK